MSTVLVTGATGLVGSRLLPRLIAEGHTCRALVRGDQRLPNGAITARADLDDPGTLPSAVQGVDAVVHLAALFRTDDEAAIWRANLEGTRNLVDAVTTHAPSARFIMASTGNVYDQDQIRPGQESDPCHPTAAYPASKIAAEALLRDSHLNWSVLRLPFVYGDGDGHLASIPALGPDSASILRTPTPSPITATSQSPCAWHSAGHWTAASPTSPTTPPSRSSTWPASPAHRSTAPHNPWPTHGQAAWTPRSCAAWGSDPPFPPSRKPLPTGSSDRAKAHSVRQTARSLPTCVSPPPEVRHLNAGGEALCRGGGLASTSVASPCAAVRGWVMVARSPEAVMTSTTLRPFQPHAIRPPSSRRCPTLARYTGQTHILYAYQLRRWFAWCDTNGLDPLVGLQRAQIECAIRHLHDSGLRDSSINTMLHGVRGFFRFAHIDGRIAADPAVYARLPKIHADETRTQGVDRLELIRFLKVAQTLTVHHGVLAFLLGINALRASEAAAVRIEDYARSTCVGTVSCTWLARAGSPPLCR